MSMLEKYSKYLKESKDIKHKIKKVHISTIKWGDTVMIDGKMKTVGKNDIYYATGMGYILFGDSYRLGTLKVDKVIFESDNSVLEYKGFGKSRKLKNGEINKIVVYKGHTLGIIYADEPTKLSVLSASVVKGGKQAIESPMIDIKFADDNDIRVATPKDFEVLGYDESKFKNDKDFEYDR